MSTQLQLRRGNTAQTAVFTGAVGEVTVITDQNTITVHDGITAGGHIIATGPLLQAAWNQANASYNQANTTNTYAGSAYGQANATNTYATSGYNQANVATTLAQAGYNQANATNTYANSGYNVANTANANIIVLQGEINSANANISVLFGIEITQNTNISTVNNYATSAYGQANSAYGQAIATNNYATSGYGQANTATTLAQASYNQANATNTYATSGYNQANATNTYATTAYGQANATNTYATSGYNQANIATTLAQASFNNSNTKFNSSGGTISGNVTINGSLSVTGNIVYTGTVSVANGGTGLTTLTAGYIPYGAGISAFGSVSTLNYDAANTTFNAPVLATTSFTSTTPSLSFNASNAPLAMGGTVSGSYFQSVLQNKSGTAVASTNYVLSNDLGTDSTYYGEFGMNSSVYTGAGVPSDFYSINNGIYFSGHDGDITVGSGNGKKLYFAWGSSGQYAHVINTSGAIGLNTNLAAGTGSGTTNYGNAGQVMISGGSSATPVWGAVAGGGF
jgi:hypothetical protein